MQYDDALAGEIAVVLQTVNPLRPPVDRETQTRALTAAYAVITAASASVPTYATFFRLARARYNWTAGEFQIFAATRTWKHV